MVALRSLALLSLLFSPAFSMVIRSDHHAVDIEATIKGDMINDLRKQTNADRLAKGLGPLPPTRRSSGLKPRQSGNPGTASTEDFGDAFGGPSVIRLRRPDGSEVGVITFPHGDSGDLVIIDPDTSRAQKFRFDKNGQNGEPFEIYPVNDGDDVFGGKNPLLAARPRGGKPAMGPGSPDFLHIGIGHLTDGGLLDVALPQNLLSHGSGPLGSLGGITAPLTGGGDGGLLNAALPDVLGGDLLGPLGGPVDSLTEGPSDGPVPALGTIWIFDPKTRKLAAHYPHPDGHGIPTSFVTGGPCQHLICLTADVEAFRNAYGDDAVELHALVTVL